MQRPVPVGDDDDAASRPRAAPRSAGAASGIGEEAQRRQQRVEQHVAVDAAAARGAIASAQRARRSASDAGVAALVQMRAVVGDLGPDRGLAPPPRRRRRPSARAAPRADAAPAARSAAACRGRRADDRALVYCARHGGCGYWHRRTAWINAGASILVAFVLATLRRPGVPGAAPRARPRSATGISREGATRLRFVRRLLYAAIVADRHRGRAVGLHRHLQPRDQPARLGRDRRRDHRLRRAPDAGQLRRRDHARDHAADPGRRLGDVRGQLRRGRGRAPQLHDPAHGDRAADRDPEREARRRRS